MKLSENIEYYNIDLLDFNTSDKFDLIYLDPPYKTNRDFTLDSNNDVGFSDKWISSEYSTWLNKIIEHLEKLLSNVGTLIFHISSDNSFICESILRKYFQNIQKIFWKRCHGKNSSKNKLGEVIDIIFACSNKTGIFNGINIPISSDSKWAFKNKDNIGFYSLGALKHDRTRTGYDYITEHNGVKYVSQNGWKKKKEIVEKLIEDNRIHFSTKQKNMYVKIYKHEHTGVPLSNLWNDIHNITRTTKDPRLYPTQKPQKLLERIIKIYSNEDSLVLDPVCGSGTTGFVCDKIGRKCVLIDINQETESIIKKRFEDKLYNF